MLLSAFYLATAQDMRFEKLEGTQSVIHAMLEDKQGFLWVGTQEGLYKYNGYDFKTYKRIPKDSNSLSDNFIWCIHQSPNGIIWIGTNGGGLNAYNPLTDKFTRYQYKKEFSNSPLEFGNIKCIKEDKAGNLYIGTEDGLVIFNPQKGQIQHFKQGNNGLKHNFIYSILIDKNENIWVGTFGAGVHLYQKQTQKFIQYTDFSQLENRTENECMNIRDMFQDKFGNIWVGTSGAGLLRFNPISKQFDNDIKYDLNISRGIWQTTQDEEDKLWIGTHAGLRIYDFSSNTFKLYKQDEKNPFSLSLSNVRCILHGKNGIVWIGTDGAGINVYKKLSNQFEHYTKKEVADSSSLASEKVMTFAEDANENLWIGTLNGINIMNKDKKVVAHYNYPQNKVHYKILSLYKSSDGLIWIGSWGNGANFFDPSTETFSETFNTENERNETTIAGNTVLSIKEDRKKNIWFATLNGISIYQPEVDSFTNITTFEGLTANTVNTLYYYEEKNEMWAGTSNGISVIDAANFSIKRKYQAQENDSGLSNNVVFCLYADKENNMWIGTYTGLNKLSFSNNRFTHYYEKDGLVNDLVLAISEDIENNLWLTTSKGLSKYYKDKELKSGESAFKNYLPVDGIQGEEFNQGAFYQLQSGEIVAGGINGFNRFHPTAIKSNTSPPNVYITSFKVFEKELALDSNILFKKHITLSYQEKFFSFEFVALDFQTPSKILYSWKMEGIDDDWSPPGNRRFVSYSNLPGGNYAFRVRACNNDGVWNEVGAVIYLTIVPPFWKTNFFYALCIFLAVLSVVLYNRIRTNKIKREKKILEEKVEERTFELEEKNRDILSSIQYAKRIQEAILPPLDIIYEHFPNAFVLFLPKDIVSGDFYWFAEKNGKKIIAAVDCTGHGVPGAFMSMIGHNLLNQIVIENNVTDAAGILNQLNDAIVSALKQDAGSKQESRDGMDIALCVVDAKNNIVQFAGAYRPLYLIRNNTLEKMDGNKFPIGGIKTVEDKTFTAEELHIQKGDTLYLFSDGFADQFGGKEGKKFMMKRFRELLLDINHLSMRGQSRKLEESLKQWQGTQEQVDDILVIGIQF